MKDNFNPHETLVEFLKRDAERTVEDQASLPKKLQADWYRRTVECRNELPNIYGSLYCVRNKDHKGPHRNVRDKMTITWEPYVV